MLLYVHRDRTDTTVRVQCCLTSTETVRILQFEFNVALRPQRPYGYYSSSLMLPYVHRDRTDTTVRVQCCFMSTETVWILQFEFSVALRPQRPYYYRRGAQDGHLNFT